MDNNRILHLMSLTLLGSLPSCESPPDVPEQAAVSFRSAHSGGLELHWTFEDRIGNQIIDMSGNERHGTLSGGSFVSSPWGQAASFDGVDDKISFSGPRDPNMFGGATSGSFTVSAHVRVEDVNRMNYLCTGCGPFSHMTIGTHNVGNRVLGSIHDPTASPTQKSFPTSTNSLVDDTWTHVTMVVEAGVGTTFYLNCEFDRFVANTNLELKDYSYSSVGEGGNSTSWYEGEIDDLKVWSRALSAEDIGDLCPCGGAPEAYTLGIAPPTPPLRSSLLYEAPEENYPDVIWVDNSEELQAEVSAGTETIVLRNGTYGVDDINGNHLLIKGQKLWAESVGGVILEFGIDAGGDDGVYSHSGSELHGLVFDIVDEDNAPDWGDGMFPEWAPGTAVISAWGDAYDLVIEDTVIHGGPIDTGIYVRSAAGFEARRLEIDRLNRHGILIEGPDTLSTAMTLTDIRVWDISDPNNSVAGIGIRLGETADLSRVHIRDVRHAGVVINGESFGSTVSHVDVDRLGTNESSGRVGIYFDRVAKNVTADHFCVGPNSRIGVNSEWDNCSSGDWPDCSEPHMMPRGINNVVEHGLIEASLLGVHFDQGTVRGYINNVTFRNYTRAAIVMHNNASSETVWPIYDVNGSNQSDNTFEETEVNCSVCDVTHTIWNNATPQCVGQSAC